MNKYLRQIRQITGVAYNAAESMATEESVDVTVEELPPSELGTKVGFIKFNTLECLSYLSEVNGDSFLYHLKRPVLTLEV